jgi:HEAT repeat protein
VTPQSRHMSVIKDLRVTCILRKRVVGEGVALVAAPSAVPNSLRTLSVADLAEAAGNEHGPRLKQVLIELEKRSGDQVIGTLGYAAATDDNDIKKLARDLLTRHLSRQTAATLKEKLKDDRPEVRATAARLIGSRKLRLGEELIELLTDAEADVRQAAREALVRLSGGPDFGPERKASADDQARAASKWRDWWSSQGGR